MGFLAFGDERDVDFDDVVVLGGAVVVYGFVEEGADFRVGTVQPRGDYADCFWPGCG